MFRLALAFFALLLLPSSAHGAEGFLGVLEDGRTVRFSSQETLALSTPRRPVGLAPGERLVALSDGPSGLVGVGSSARLYALDAGTGRATAIGAPFEQGLRGSRFSLAAAPGATSGRLLSDVGQDLIVDLRTGAAQPGPGLLGTDGAIVRPAADVGPDGRLVGLQLGPATFLRETEPGSATMAASRLRFPPEIPLAEPIAFQVGADGRGYALGLGGGNVRRRQSVMMAIDLATGTVVGGDRARVFFFTRRLTSFISLGRVADDRTRPRVTVSFPRTISVRSLLTRGLPGRVKTDEAAQVSASLRLGGRQLGFGFTTRDIPGTVALRDAVVLRVRDRAVLRRSAGRRVRILVSVNDLKGNTRSLAATARLTR